MRSVIEKRLNSLKLRVLIDLWKLTGFCVIRIPNPQEVAFGQAIYVPRYLNRYTYNTFLKNTIGKAFAFIWHFDIFKRSLFLDQTSTNCAVNLIIPMGTYVRCGLGVYSIRCRQLVGSEQKI